jgi:hypothetical protein
MNAISNGTARVGNSFLRVTTSQAGGSVAIDTIPGQLFAVSVYALAWVRAPQGAVQGVLNLWELGHSPAANLRSMSRNFEVYDDKWIMIENALDAAPAGNSSQVNFRVEFYVSTVNTPLDIDAVMFWD